VAVRGRSQPHRTGIFPPGESVRAAAVLKPGDYVRGLYEELVSDMGISGAEVVREALIELHKRESRRKARSAAKNANTNAKELPQAG
jgi:hypothetical protein